jgi:D-alanine-D-alanine ligase
MLSMLGIPYTGAEILAESLAYNKFLVKKLLQQAGVPIPNYQLFNTPNDPIDSHMRFPLISKLNEIHGAVEITSDSISENEKHLRERLRFLIKTYKQPVLVEEFIVGREVTAFLLEGLNRKVYMAEKVFNKPNDKYIFATFDDQWGEYDKSDRTQWVYDYAKYDDPVLREYVKRAFDTCKMLSYGKFDIRIDAANRYYFIDSNSNPALGPMESGCAISYVLNLYDISFTEILRRLLMNALYGKVDENEEPVPEQMEIPAFTSSAQSKTTQE